MTEYVRIKPEEVGGSVDENHISFDVSVSIVKYRRVCVRMKILLVSQLSRYRN